MLLFLLTPTSTQSRVAVRIPLGYPDASRDSALGCGQRLPSSPVGLWRTRTLHHFSFFEAVRSRLWCCFQAHEPENLDTNGLNSPKEPLSAY